MKLCYILAAIAASVIAAPNNRYHNPDADSQHPRPWNTPEQARDAGQGSPQQRQYHSLAPPDPDLSHSNWEQAHAVFQQQARDAGHIPQPTEGQHAPPLRQMPPAPGPRQGSPQQWQYHSLAPPNQGPNLSHSNRGQAHASLQEQSEWHRALEALDVQQLQGQPFHLQPRRALARHHPGHASPLRQTPHAPGPRQGSQYHSLAPPDQGPNLSHSNWEQAHTVQQGQSDAPTGQGSHPQNPPATPFPPPSDPEFPIDPSDPETMRRHEAKHLEAAENWDRTIIALKNVNAKMEEAAKKSKQKAFWTAKMKARKDALKTAEMKAAIHRQAAEEGNTSWLYGRIGDSVMRATTFRVEADKILEKSKKWK